MTNEYRTAQLAAAEAQYAVAKVAAETAKTKKARRAAHEDIEFWGNKIAFLSHAV